ncbi:MAG: DUF1538 domain-containing protein [Deltaproteobacteria bacterium]|nr:DUF1538 domain-containing protein [Deltaproteobacteria bacterium]
MKQTLALLLPYIKDRIMTQVKSVWLIIIYLVFFQAFILKIPVFNASVISAGIGLVVIGLALFMEGLFLGLMRMGSIIGGGLPKKYPMAVVLFFGLILGFLATLAEPSIQILQMAGSSVKAWEAPLLFLLLNRYPHYLVWAVGAGVGTAVCLGMVRFYYSVSLKPFIYIFLGALMLLTLWAAFDPNLNNIMGLAWDCGAVTTGPVTVPLVLALGIGISRMVGKADSGATGFGVVTLASLLPVLSVFGLGIFFSVSVPQPMSEKDFFNKDNRAAIGMLFEDNEALFGYVLTEAGNEGRLSFFDGDNLKLSEYLANLAVSRDKASAVLGDEPHALELWALKYGTEDQRILIFGSLDNMRRFANNYVERNKKEINIRDLIERNTVVALKAIGLLILPLFLVLFFLVRESVPYPDEIFLGIFFCIIGFAIFNMGIELGLDKLGKQVGARLPSSFKTIELTEENKTIIDFDPGIIQTAVSTDGKGYQFFYIEEAGRITTVPYNPEGFDGTTRQYQYTPVKGPLFGSDSAAAGILVVILFAFVMGYGATLAEPALNALGITVEEYTAGAFKKSLLMQAVAVGVGTGIAIGVSKIVLSIPLVWILVPSYALLIIITEISTEEFVNIGWDSAGVTTGPITVPLVLAMGLGLGSQVGVVEGFGILAAASIYPILTVLLLGIYVNRKRSASLIRESVEEREQ